MKTIKKSVLILIAAALAVLALSACGVLPFWEDVQADGPASVEYYSVTFDIGDGKLISGELNQQVKKGEAAVAPEVKNGRKALSWDTDFSNVTSDLTVKAVWERRVMSSTEIAKYGQACTVTVNVIEADGSASGSGFFIDEEGTIVTAFHVIEGARKISVTVENGDVYDIDRVVAFNPVYDLAIISIDYKNDEYLEICKDDVLVGEPVYAVGSALGVLPGTFTAGVVSSVKRNIGKIECIQTDTAISKGCSGGPLLNAYCEVIGINCFSYTRAENANFVVKVSLLEKIGETRNFTMSEMINWYENETARSYYLYYEGEYYKSLVNTYQNVTGSSCLTSVDDEGNFYDGYISCHRSYFYRYDRARYEKYVQYLEDHGFVYDNTVSGDGGEKMHTYINEKDWIEIHLYISGEGNRLIVGANLY